MARSLAPGTIVPRLAMIRRLQAFANDYPWVWAPRDLDEFFGELPSASAPISVSTVRAYQGALRLRTRFAAYREVIGLPPEIGLHCLRHSCVTHLIEDGYDPMFVQQEVGHSCASTTALYTSVSSDFRTRTLRLRHRPRPAR